MTNNKYDVIVVGLGTAGAVAAIYAAKSGLRVAGIERLNAMGGTGTLGGVGRYYFGARGGFFEEMNAQTEAMQRQNAAISNEPGMNTKAYVLEQAARQAGVDLFLEGTVTAVSLQGKKVEGVTCLQGGKMFDLTCRFLIDCTGEAEVCSLCGCETSMGRTFDHQTQPYTNIVLHSINGCVEPRNLDAGYVTQNQAAQYAKAVVDSLALNWSDPTPFSAMPLMVTTAALLGVREGAVIKGEQTVTLADFLAGHRTHQPLFYAYSNIDNHGKDTALEDEIMKDWYVGAGLWSVNFSVGVPMGALIPKGFDGLLAAGRHISVDHNIAPCIRMKSDMEKCGEAAAAIALLAIRQGVPATQVDYQALRELLTSTRCLDEANNIGWTNRTAQGVVPFAWLTDIDQIKEGLCGDAPGIALWSARLLGEEMIPILTPWLDQPDEGLAKQAAIALGLLGDGAGLPILRRMAAQREMTIPRSGIKYNYTLGTTALYLLGKLGDEQGVPLLQDVIADGGAFDHSQFAADEFYATADDVSFQLVSYAVAALVELKQKRPHLAPAIDAFLRRHIVEREDALVITLKANPHARVDLLPKLKAYTHFCI